MVKFLSGGQFDGSLVPVCTFWREDLTTNKDEDFAEITSEGASDFTCVANAYFDRDSISCFNDGGCNGEGKCLPCTKYKYGGMRLAISHSPPIEILRNFDRGLTEEQLQSPNLVKFPPSVAQTVVHDQLPYHILLRNIQAEIAKCCRWSVGDGKASRFVVASIRNGPDTLQVTDENGDTVNLNGIRVNHPAFPDDGTDGNPEGGSFFPVGLRVVAGWEDQPSFYLEPRTGLVKNGDGIVFPALEAGSNSFEIKRLAVSAGPVVQDASDSIDYSGAAAEANQNQAVNFFNNVVGTGASNLIESAQAQLDAADAALTAANDARTEADDIISDASGQAQDVVDATTPEDLQSAAAELAASLEALAVQVEAAGAAAGGGTESDVAAAQSRRLKSLARSLRFSGGGGRTKCEFFFEDNNVAAAWNAPEDGSLLCNGMRSDCQFYTGPAWEFATTEKMEVGQPITAEQIQEVRFHSDDWKRFTNPEQEFRTRFSTPFVWAFKGYVDVFGEPNVEDMLLYRPKSLFTRGSIHAEYETIEVEKVEITDFDDFEVTKSRARIQPGSDTLDQDSVPDYPNLITEPVVPTATRLRITHPRTEEPFVYRSWSHLGNKAVLFGVTSPNNSVYLVNETALRNRERYLTFYEAANINEVPNGLPGAPTFNGISASELRTIFTELEKEKSTNSSQAVLGFDIATTDITGFWSSLQQVDLVHNELNVIYAFVLIDDDSFLFDRVEIDYRFLHSIVTQDTFTGKDYTMYNFGGGEDGSRTGIATGNIAQTATITAQARQILGSEPVTFHHGYYGWRFKNRGLQNGILSAPSDLQGSTQVADNDPVSIVTEADASAFITSTAYRVVQYRKTTQVTDWYRVDDCGLLMLNIEDTNVHRVFPMPNQQGDNTALTNVLINNGATGSAEAQWAIESATLTTGGEEKNLVQIYRSEEGFGLPANYVLLGPGPNVEDAFGRPDPESDTLEITYVFLQAQTNVKDGEEFAAEANGFDEVVNENFHGDSLRTRDFSFEFEEGSGNLTVGGDRPDNIQAEQQDWCFVFKDSEGRPIGRKITRFLIMYYNLSCINVEIFYAWRGTCTTYGLKPDLFLTVGQDNGTVTSAPKGTVNPADLQLGFRVANLLGEHDCGQIPNCGDHELIRLGPLRKEFEVILFGEQFPGGKAFFPSAGQTVPRGDGITSTDEPPGSQWQLKRGPMWYPYIDCERPRYKMQTNGPLGTDSTELINTTLKNPGMGSAGLQTAAQVSAGGGEFGNLPDRSQEAYRGPDQVRARVLDVHPSLRPCTSAFTYGNQVLTGSPQFTGYARRRGEIDRFWYEGLQWVGPPFGNFGRPRLVLEVASKRGDYIDGDRTGFRWMPMFPEREDIGATVDLFGEEIEPQHYRLLTASTPVGDMAETIPTRSSPRFSHKALIQNRAGAGIEYPYAPYFPSFLPDSFLGQEPAARGEAPGEGDATGTITTMHAWREQDKPIRRGEQGSEILSGIQFTAPDYFIDNRRLEVRLRPEEGVYNIKYTPPTFELDGTVTSNASIQIGDGAPREIEVDFVTKTLNVLAVEDSFYDTSKLLGEGAFECTEGTASDNLELAESCSCSPDPGEDSEFLPARMLHLDELAPAGFFALYSDNEMQVPFTTDIPREAVTDPCCICNFYLHGIWFKLDSDFIPVTQRIDPAFSPDIDLQYTWSRVPHGFGGGPGEDGGFNGDENLADNYIDHSSGEVFVNRFNDGVRRINPTAGTAAFFPSQTYVLENNVVVNGLAPTDPKLKGGIPVAADGTSRGETETIVLDMLFDTYVSIRRVTIGFLAGAGLEVPELNLAIVDPANRTGELVTTRASREVAADTDSFTGINVPNSQFFNSADIENGEVLFRKVLEPNYEDQPFWNKFGMEWHLVFGNRLADLSMGIAYIELEIDALSDELQETIFIPERKYYTSTGSAPGGNNPEEFLAELDSATVYWRTTSESSLEGANRFRAYSWGPKIQDNQPGNEGPIEELEQLQREEYDRARDLLGRPYQFSYTGFFPLDEQEWIDFLGGNQPSWSTLLSMDLSEIEQVTNADNDMPVYGEPPIRNVWSAPGHAWTYVFEVNYQFCCFPCPKAMVINYEFAHLHDNLKIVETARFWDELPTGFNRLIRSTMMSPDATFGQSNESGLGIDGGSTGRPVLLDEGLFEGIDVTTLENAGFAKDPDGDGFVIVDDGV